MWSPAVRRSGLHMPTRPGCLILFVVYILAGFLSTFLCRERNVPISSYDWGFVFSFSSAYFYLSTLKRYLDVYTFILIMNFLINQFFCHYKTPISMTISLVVLKSTLFYKISANVICTHMNITIFLILLLRDANSS